MKVKELPVSTLRLKSKFIIFDRKTSAKIWRLRILTPLCSFDLLSDSSEDINLQFSNVSRLSRSKSRINVFNLEFLLCYAKRIRLVERLLRLKELYGWF